MGRITIGAAIAGLVTMLGLASVEAQIVGAGANNGNGGVMTGTSGTAPT